MKRSKFADSRAAASSCLVPSPRSASLTSACAGSVGPAQFQRRIERQLVVAQALRRAPTQMKIICDKGLGIDVDRPDLAQNLGARGRSAGGFAGGADLDHRQPDRAPDGSFDEGHALVVDQHRARERGHRRSIVDAVLERDGRLGLGQIAAVRRLVQREDVAAGLIEAGPIPGLAGRDVVLADVDQFLARADLPLRPVKHHAHPVLAVEELNVVKHIAVVGSRLGEAQQFVVAVDFGFPAGRQSPSKRERSNAVCAFSGRLVIDRPAAERRRAAQFAVEALDVADRRNGSRAPVPANGRRDPTGRRAAATPTACPSGRC